MKKYFLLTKYENGTFTFQQATAEEVDGIIGFNESSFLDFPIEDGLRRLQDNQYDYVVAEERQAMEFYMMDLIVNFEEYFDNLPDPANPSDPVLYEQMGVSLDSIIEAKSQLTKTKDVGL